MHAMESMECMDLDVFVCIILEWSVLLRIQVLKHVNGSCRCGPMPHFSVSHERVMWDGLGIISFVN